jgi:hypothetical protein
VVAPSAYGKPCWFHSDGGSIATIHAGAVRMNAVGVVLIAAHLFVEARWV